MIGPPTGRRVLRATATLGPAAILWPGQARPQARQVTIAIKFGYAYLPVILAEKLGLFARHAAAVGLAGVEFAVQRISGAPAINDALINGTVDIGAYGLPGMLIAWERTKGRIGIRGLAGLTGGDNALFASRPGIAGLQDLRPDDWISVTAMNSQQAILLRMAAEKQFGTEGARRFDTMMVALPPQMGSLGC